ncbi:hypothetical protein [Rhizobium leguminosarum]|uniref:hypothetical protein n=1 Tax=Rhizobium leguminosarum TaxID=384 RepID=UPI003F95F039
MKSFVKECLNDGNALLEKHRDMTSSLRASLEQNPPTDYAIPVAILLGDFSRARELVESRRENDGVFLEHVPRQADRYLGDLGF